MRKLCVLFRLQRIDTPLPLILEEIEASAASARKAADEARVAGEKAAEDVRKYGNLPVPLHIRNAPTKLMENLEYGKGYKYSPDYDYKEKQEYLPKELKDKKYLE